MSEIEFCEMLKKVRKKSKKTVQETSNYLKSLGYKAEKQTIYGWERGVSQPNPDVFLEMCVFYDVEDVLAAFGYKKSSLLKSEDLESFAELKKYIDS